MVNSSGRRLAMSGNFLDFVKNEDIDFRTLEDALKSYVYRNSGFMTDGEMRSCLVEAGSAEDGDELGSAIKVLETDVEARNRLIYAFFEDEWTSPGGEEAVRNAILNAQTKLPIIEIAIIATSILYGLWLQKTSGVRKDTIREETRPDGSKTVVRTVENYPFAQPLNSLLRRLS
jgi:hypothetical protein